MRPNDQDQSEMATLATNAQDNKYPLSWQEFQNLCSRLTLAIDWSRYDSIFPILRGGLYPAVELSRKSGLPIAWNLTERPLIIDEISDSGATLKPFVDDGFDVAVIHWKGRSQKPTYFAETTEKWVVYPWEKDNEIERCVLRQIEYIGDSPTREGLEETPKRVVKSWNELYSGYREDPKKILSKRFFVERKRSNESPVILRDIEFYSTCEHHLLPFYGTITIGYLPSNSVVGISKLARLVECFARRLQIQERLCEQIADAIQSELDPRGVYVRAKAKHLCMIARGVQKQNAEMESVAVRGEYEAIEKLI